MTRTSMLALAVLAAACAPKRVHEEPIIDQGARMPDASATIEAARLEAARTSETVARRDSLAALSLSTCGGDVCDAVARGEVALGMNVAQVLAATQTTESAWTFRSAGDATVMTPAARAAEPRDAIGTLAMVRLNDGLVRSYSYREAQGVRAVRSPADATVEGRADALAEMLLREGDDYVARGELDRALDRYDRAQILRPGEALVDYRIATVLDKQLRPIEALVRYQLFLHGLEIERIRAVGEAYGNLAQAIAHAKERIIVLERQGR